MPKKSIAELERYENFLFNLIEEIENCSQNNIFDSGEVDHYDMAKNLEKLESIQDILVILHHEIKTAVLSNSITYENEEMSLYQAELLLKNMKKMLCHYSSLRKKLWDSKNNIENIKFKQQTIGESVLSERVEAFVKSIYQLENRLVREKNKIFVEIDVSSIMLEHLTDT